MGASSIFSIIRSCVGLGSCLIDHGVDVGDVATQTSLYECAKGDQQTIPILTALVRCFDGRVGDSCDGCEPFRNGVDWASAWHDAEGKSV